MLYLIEQIYNTLQHFQHWNTTLYNIHYLEPNIEYFLMNNRELKNIIEEIEAKEDITLKDIAAKSKLDRSNLSTLLNSEEIKSVTTRMVNKIKKHFPGYFKDEQQKLQKQQNQHERASDPMAEALNIIKEQNAWLRNMIDTNLAALSTEVNNNTAAIRAEIRGYAQRQILKEVNYDDDAFLKAKAEADKIYLLSLKQLLEDNKSDARKKHKEGQ